MQFTMLISQETKHVFNVVTISFPKKGLKKWKDNHPMNAFVKTALYTLPHSRPRSLLHARGSWSLSCHPAALGIGLCG